MEKFMNNTNSKTKQKERWYGIRSGEKTGVRKMTYEEAQTWEPKEIKGFDCEEEARKYVGKGVDWNAVQAIAYVDGSLNFGDKDMDMDKKYASYGIVIYVKDLKEPFYVESGRIWDGVKQKGEKRNLEVERYNWAGIRVGTDRKVMDGTEPEDVWYVDVNQGKDGKDGFVMASWSDAAEGYAAYRAMQICLEELQLENIAVVYDHQALWDICFNPKRKKNVPNFVGGYYKAWEEQGKKVNLIKVNSHNKGKYERTDPLFFHGVFNDCVDMLSKAETEKRPISNKENSNAAQIIGGIQNMTKGNIPLRRMQARQYVAEVTKMINPFDEMMK